MSRQSGYRELPDGVVGLDILVVDEIGLGKPHAAGTEKPDPPDVGKPALSRVEAMGRDEAEPVDVGISFASDWDQTCYHALLARQRALHAQLDAVERALYVILSRAQWSAEAIMERDG